MQERNGFFVILDADGETLKLSNLTGLHDETLDLAELLGKDKE